MDYQYAPILQERMDAKELSVCAAYLSPFPLPERSPFRTHTVPKAYDEHTPLPISPTILNIRAYARPQLCANYIGVDQQHRGLLPMSHGHPSFVDPTIAYGKLATSKPYHLHDGAVTAEPLQYVHSPDQHMPDSFTTGWMNVPGSGNTSYQGTFYSTGSSQNHSPPVTTRSGTSTTEYFHNLDPALFVQSAVDKCDYYIFDNPILEYNPHHSVTPFSAASDSLADLPIDPTFDSPNISLDQDLAHIEWSGPKAPLPPVPQEDDGFANTFLNQKIPVSVVQKRRPQNETKAAQKQVLRQQRRESQRKSCAAFF